MKLNNPLHQIILWFCLMLALVLVLFSCNNKKEFKIPHNPYDISKDTNAYHFGDTLYPDYVHSDTLIVVGANALNWIFDGVENPVPTTDGEIDSVLHLYTTGMNGHQCRWKLCPYKGITYKQWHTSVRLYVDDDDESPAFQLDMLHLQYPTWEYEQLEEAITND